jgi:chromosomal replication initiator protein
VEYIAENFNTNIRDLEGALNRILLLAEMNGVSTSQVIDQMTPVTPSGTRHISPKQVIDKVAKYYNLNSKDILGKSRIKDIKNARQIAMYLMNKELSLSTTKIGRELSKDHSTVIHGIDMVDKRLKEDFNLREQLSELRGKIYA